MKVCRGKRQARTAIFAVLIFVPAPDALTGDLIRQASIIDGDTEIHGGRIRLWGIDAPNPINEGS